MAARSLCPGLSRVAVMTGRVSLPLSATILTRMGPAPAMTNGTVRADVSEIRAVCIILWQSDSANSASRHGSDRCCFAMAGLVPAVHVFGYPRVAQDHGTILMDSGDPGI